MRHSFLMARKKENTPMQDKKEEKKQNSSRRGFLKKAVISGVAIAATATLAKKAAQLIPDETPQRAYSEDMATGDIELSKREYVVMTGNEKDELVRAFTENYRKKDLGI